MMSLESIHAANEVAEEKAAQKGIQPYIPTDPKEAENWPPFPFPNLGNVPIGWEEMERFFVDISGWGLPGEPAMTHKQFTTVINDYIQEYPHYGYAIVDVGQFQLCVVALKKIR